MTELGHDNYIEILVRMQVKDLIRCKSVCKSWNSLISSPPFAKSHLDNYLKKKVDNNEIGDTRIIVYSGGTTLCCDCCHNSRKGQCQLVGSSNGLVCISRYYTEFLVINPSTREVKELRNPPQEFVSCLEGVFGFGYDSSIDDYKVVIGYWIVPNEGYVFNVLNLKTNIWNSADVELDYDYELYGDGILCNGAIHWLSIDQKDKQVIVSFDLSKEVLKEIPLPKLDKKWVLGTMKDRLCVFHLLNTDSKENLESEIWVMKTDQVSWERKFLPPSYDVDKITSDYIPYKHFLSGHVHIWLLEEGSSVVLVRSIDHPISQQNRPHEHIRLATYSECNYNFYHHVFVKSLVSPHGMGVGDGHGDGDGDDSNIDDVISLSTLFL